MTRGCRSRIVPDRMAAGSRMAGQAQEARDSNLGLAGGTVDPRPARTVFAGQMLLAEWAGESEIAGIDHFWQRARGCHNGLASWFRARYWRRDPLQDSNRWDGRTWTKLEGELPPSTGGRRLNGLPLEEQVIREQFVDDAADGGPRESGPVRDGDTGDRARDTHTIEDEEPIQFAHEAQIGPPGCGRAGGLTHIARPHGAHNMADCLRHNHSLSSRA